MPNAKCRHFDVTRFRIWDELCEASGVFPQEMQAGDAQPWRIWLNIARFAVFKRNLAIDYQGPRTG